MSLLMPWGRYCGQPLTAIPFAYLRRVVLRCRFTDQRLRAAAWEELLRRLPAADRDSRTVDGPPPAA
jgi:hypothetical protein